MNRYKLLALVTALTGMMGAASAETTLTVYTALEADQIKVYQAAFEKANPDIKIQWVRDSTGIIAAKLLAEKSNPKADVIWGLAGTALGLMDKEGMLQPYAPKGLPRAVAAHLRPLPADATGEGGAVFSGHSGRGRIAARAAPTRLEDRLVLGLPR